MARTRIIFHPTNSFLSHTAFTLADQFVIQEARGFRITDPAHNTSARTPINTSTISLQHFTAQLLNPRVCLKHSGTHNTGKYCCVVRCTAGERKFAKIEKYPWMRDVTFWSFPSEARARTAHYIWIRAVRRGDSWRPNHQTRICSRHVVGGEGPTEDNPFPTLFPHNNFRLSGTPSRPRPVRRVVWRLPLP